MTCKSFALVHGPVCGSNYILRGLTSFTSWVRKERSLCQLGNKQPLSTPRWERADRNPGQKLPELNSHSSCTQTVVSVMIRLCKYRDKFLQNKSHSSPWFPWCLPTRMNSCLSSFPFPPHLCECRLETALSSCAFSQYRVHATSRCPYPCKSLPLLH